MNNRKKLIVSYAPFIHFGGSITERHYNIILAAAIGGLLPGMFKYGMQAISVACLAVSSAILWELLACKISKKTPTIGDGSAALTGLILSMLMPAGSPWWIVITGTFLSIIIGKYIFGGLGGSPFNAVAISMAILVISWKGILDFDQALLNYDFGYNMLYPLGLLKAFGPDKIGSIGISGLLLGRQTGGIGATCSIGLILAGIYLIARGFIRWEISLSFLAGVVVCAFIFNISDPSKFAGPGFHLFTGYTLIGAFFLSPEDSSSPVNFIPMLIYGLGGGVMTVLIRNIGIYIDGVIPAILVMNLVSPLIDKIRPKAIGV